LKLLGTYKNRIFYKSHSCPPKKICEQKYQKYPINFPEPLGWVLDTTESQVSDQETIVRDALFRNWLQIDKEAKRLASQTLGRSVDDIQAERFADLVLDEVIRLACSLGNVPVGVDLLLKLLPTAVAAVAGTLKTKPRGRPKKSDPEGSGSSGLSGTLAKLSAFVGRLVER
jgi:hypothetical protein